MEIKEIQLKKILNSAKKETLQAIVKTKKSQGIAASPAGNSAGKHEKNHFDKNVQNTIQISKPVLKKIIGYDTSQQEEIDALLREIPGAASISTSLAIAYAESDLQGIPLWKYLNDREKLIEPTLINLVMAGGKHAPEGPVFQEFHAIQEGEGLNSQIIKNTKIYNSIGKKNKLKETDTEHGWITDFSDEQCFKELSKQECKIGTDAAASEFYKNGKYIYKDVERTREEQIEHVTNLINKYKVRYFEDPLEEDDFGGFTEVLKNTKNCMIAGDDLTTTNIQRLGKAIKEKSINSVIIKPNQIGTLTETIDTIKLAQKNNIKCVTSHRAKETNDTYLSHITLAFGIKYMKISITGEERICKIKELQKNLQI